MIYTHQEQAISIRVGIDEISCVASIDPRGHKVERLLDDACPFQRKDVIMIQGLPEIKLVSDPLKQRQSL